MTTTPFIPKEDARRRLEAMARLFTKSDTVLSGGKVAVDITDSGIAAPSWTDGETITFNRSVVGDVQSVEDVVRVMGLNLHELAHVLFTPRYLSDVIAIVHDEGLHQAFNLLEDQRIETFLTAQYPSSIPYFVSTFMRYCIAADSAWESNFVLMYGRRYLPKEVRQEFRARFKRQDLIPAFEENIDRYRKLVYPADEAEAVVLIREYHRLLMDIMVNSGLDPKDPNGHSAGGRPDIDNGDAVPQEVQEEASQASDIFDKEFDADDDSDADGNGDSDGDGDGDGNGSGDSDLDRDGDDTTDTDAGDGGGSSDAADDANSDTDADADGGPAKGTAGDSTDDPSGSGGQGGVDRSDDDSDKVPQSSQMSDSDLRDLMDDIAKSFEDLDDVKAEVTDAQRAIVNGDGDVTVGISPGRYRDCRVDPTNVQAARMFARQLERLRADADPGWNSRQSSGRLNVKRYMDGESVDVVFDRWDEGHTEVADIECVILVDTSGSMRPQINTASAAMWTIKRAMETLDASVTVLGYDSHTSLVYDSHEKVERGSYRALSVTGWTKPRKATAEALHILTTTKRSNRIYIVITDGRWDGEALTTEMPYTADELIAEMNRREITTALAHIDSSGYYGVESHQCSVASRIESASDLVDFAKRIVTQTMKFSVVK